MRKIKVGDKEISYTNVLTTVELAGTILPLEVMTQPSGMDEVLLPPLDEPAPDEDAPPPPMPPAGTEGETEEEVPVAEVTGTAWPELTPTCPPTAWMDCQVPEVSP